MQDTSRSRCGFPRVHNSRFPAASASSCGPI